MSPRAEKWGSLREWFTALWPVVVIVVGAAAWYGEGKSRFAALEDTARDHEARLRDSEKIVPRIDQKLDDIDRLLRDHMRTTRVTDPDSAPPVRHQAG